MSSPSAKAENAQGIEYSVYVYFDPQKSKSKSPWEMKGITDNMEKAMSDAQSLHDSREYIKVEVKKKYFDQKNNRTVDMTLKVLEGNVKREMGVMTILAISFVCCGLAFAGAYFLTVK